MEKVETTVPSTTCECGYEMNASQEAFERKATPKAGDLSICWHCGRLYVFKEDLSQRSLTSDELEELKKSEVWAQVERAMAIRPSFEP